MTFTQLQDILDHIKQVHLQAAECCAHASDAADERTNLVVRVFRDWEQRLEGRLDSLQQDQRQEVLATWVQFASMDGVDQALASLRKASQDGSETLLGKSYELQGEIETLLRRLADDLNTPEVRELLLDLADFELRAAKELGVADTTQHDM
jgi:hypothetical protein